MDVTRPPGTRRALATAMLMATYGATLGSLIQRAYAPAPLPRKGSGYQPRMGRSAREIRAEVIGAAQDKRARKAAKRVQDRNAQAAGLWWATVQRWRQA